MRSIILLITIITSIAAHAQLKKLKGRWDNQNGQVLVFQKNNKALWIFYSETKSDTFRIQYAANLNTSPSQLDLSGFSSGPLQGKTLFGIVEFKGRNIIRFDCEPGKTAEVRPKQFNTEQTQTYYKKQVRR